MVLAGCACTSERERMLPVVALKFPHAWRTTALLAGGASAATHLFHAGRAHAAAFSSNAYPPPDTSRAGTADLCDVHHPESVDSMAAGRKVHHGTLTGQPGPHAAQTLLHELRPPPPSSSMIAGQDRPAHLQGLWRRDEVQRPDLDRALLREQPARAEGGVGGLSAPRLALPRERGAASSRVQGSLSRRSVVSALAPTS